MFHGIYQHYEMGFTKKKLRFNINQSSKIGHTHPTQMCFPSLVFSFRNPWFPHRVSARQSRGSGLPAQNNGRIPGPHRPVFALRQMCMYIYTHIYVFVYLFIYLCIDILLYIDVYYLYVYIFHRIHGEIQDFVHHSWNHSWSWELEHFQIQAAQSLQLHPGASGEPPPARDGGQFSAGRDGEKMWKDQKIQKYEITKSPNYWRYHLAQSFNGDFWNHHDRTLRQLVTSGISISSWGYHQQTMRYNQHGTTDYCGHNLKNQNGLSYSTDSQLASAVLLCLLLLILGDHTFLWGKSGGKWCK